MRWQITVRPRSAELDSLATTVLKRLKGAGTAPLPKLATARLFELAGDIDEAQAGRLAAELLHDPVVETFEVAPSEAAEHKLSGTVSVFRRQGVMDPVEAGILRGAARLGANLERARSGTSYAFEGLADEQLATLAERFLANVAVEAVVLGATRFPVEKPWGGGAHGRVEVPLTEADDARLETISRDGGLSLTLEEMQTIKAYYQDLGREPSEIELESLAQTWSEHCKHKTLTGIVRYEGDPVPGVGGQFTVEGLLQRTIKKATEDLDRDFCLSVFHDNAGVIAFHEDQALCIKVETHNHPSAIEPYGGAGTGIGGVIRDILGTGLGARPVANVDVFCVAPVDTPEAELPKGVLPPKRVLEGVVEGVRDYGNQMGIPTVAGAVLFDDRYVGNPLVYAGTVGLLPTDKVDKKVHPGDAIVALGGRTGRDGIHGATFSSAELHEASETVDSGAVQIGNAITEKKVLDVLLEARDRDLYRAVTDCGAGGFSSAVGEMGEHTGARVHLERAPLKYAGLSPTEIWISEAQERMVLAVPQEKVEELLELSRSEDVEATVLGEFTDTGRLELFHEGQLLGDVTMAFLHDGVPKVTREATWTAPRHGEENAALGHVSEDLHALLSHPDVASKEWIIRQYDHEVQAGSVVKPLVGTRGHGPSDGSVIAPILGVTAGFAIGLGMNPRHGDLDPYHMATVGIDEAIRNVVSVGGDPHHCAILDNFSWGNCSKADRLGGLLRAAYGCHDAAIALSTPFVSGKDSLNNEYRVGDQTIVIPPSLLITALAKVPDIRRAVTMDLKRAGSKLVLVGQTTNALGGSLLHALRGHEGGRVPTLDLELAPKLHRAVHAVLKEGHALSCHDLSEGGLAVALAEMVIAGEVGADVQLEEVPCASDARGTVVRLFSESPTRYLLEVAPEQLDQVLQGLSDLPHAVIGTTTEAPTLRIHDGDASLLEATATDLEKSWRYALTDLMEGRQAGDDSHA